MADKKATLIVQLQDLATAGLETLGGAIQNLRAYAMELGISLAAVTAGLAATFKAFMDNESQINRLNGALISQGFYTKEYSQSLQELAKSLQSTTTFSREQVLSTETMLTSFGLAGKELRAATKAVLDLSAGLKIDLHSATMMVAKAWEGQTASLHRFGIVINNSGTQAEKFAEVLKVVGDKFGGRAEGEVNTYAGKIQQLGNRFRELEIVLAEVLLPVADRFLGWVEKAVSKLESVSGALTKSAGYHGKVVEALDEQIKETEALIQVMQKGGIVSDAAEAKLKRLTAAREREVEAIKKQKKATMELALETGPKSKIDPEAAINDQIKAAEKMAKMAKTKGFGPWALWQDKQKEAEAEINLEYVKNQKIMSDEERKSVREKQLEKLKADNFKSTLEFISSLSTSKNKELAIIGKAGATAMAIIHTADAVTVALESAPPPFNFVLAAAVGAAGAAQIATIAGVQLAAGGMVLPSSGGTLATIGEAGHAEAVIPLDDPKTTQKLRETMGGNVTVQIGTLIADQGGMEEFARRLDRVLFRLKKNNQTVSI